RCRVGVVEVVTFLLCPFDLLTQGLVPLMKQVVMDGGGGILDVMAGDGHTVTPFRFFHSTSAAWSMAWYAASYGSECTSLPICLLIRTISSPCASNMASARCSSSA